MFSWFIFSSRGPRICDFEKCNILTSKVQNNAKKTIQHLENIVNSKAQEKSASETSTVGTTNAPPETETTTKPQVEESTTGKGVKAQSFKPQYKSFFLVSGYRISLVKTLNSTTFYLYYIFDCLFCKKILSKTCSFHGLFFQVGDPGYVTSKKATS